MTVKYALLIYGQESAWQDMAEEELQATYRQYDEFGKWLAEQGWARGGEELSSTSSATSVRLENGRAVTTVRTVAIIYHSRHSVEAFYGYGPDPFGEVAVGLRGEASLTGK